VSVRAIRLGSSATATPPTLLRRANDHDMG
jgi:hypothetical protein